MLRSQPGFFITVRLPFSQMKYAEEHAQRIVELNLR